MPTIQNPVGFVVGSSLAYRNLQIKDSDTLYFLTDTNQIMKGESDYSSSVIYADVLPHRGIPGKLYIVGGKASLCTSPSTWTTIFDFDAKADLKGAIFTGSVKITVEPVDDQDVATKKYVDTAIASNDAMRFKGTIGEGGTITQLPTSGVRRGDTYKVIEEGIYAGRHCKVGDMIIAINDVKQGAGDDDWSVIQGNIEGAVIGPQTATDNNIPSFDGSTGTLIKDSGKKFGTDTLESDPNANTVATELAVKTYVDDADNSLKAYLESYTDDSSLNVKNTVQQYTDQQIADAKEEMEKYADQVVSGKMVWTEI